MDSNDIERERGITILSKNTAVFYKDTKLTTVKLPTNATTLGSSVFEGCTGLVAVNLPTKLTEIADFTFKGCSKLVSDEVDKVRQSEEGNTEITYNSYLNFPSEPIS